MFLVVLRHSMDDVPYRLCKTRRSAVAVARRASVLKAYEYADRLEIDCSTPVCWYIYEFDKHGEIVGGEYFGDAIDIPNPRHVRIIKSIASGKRISRKARP